MKILQFLAKVTEYALILLIIITINFLLTRYMPGDPLVHLIGEEEYYHLMERNPQAIEEVRARYGLDKPLPEQYGRYITHMLTLNFGYSYIYKKPVLDELLFRMQWTLLLVIPSVLISAVLGAVLGIKAGWKPGGKFDLSMTPFMLVMNTIPTYCLSIIILTLLSFKAGIFPVGGMTSGGLQGMEKVVDIIWHMLLPLLILVLYKTSYNYLIMKSSVVDASGEDYVLTAVSKGLPERRVRRRHVLKNALLPYITIVCMQFGYAVAGTMMIEVVFSWKGMGTLIYKAVQVKDYPMLQLSFLLISVCVILSNIAAEILYAVIDPRVKEGKVHA